MFQSAVKTYFRRLNYSPRLFTALHGMSGNMEGGKAKKKRRLVDWQMGYDNIINPLLKVEPGKFFTFIV